VRGRVAVAATAGVVAGLMAGMSVAVAGTRGPDTGGTWRSAKQVPGLAALNQGENASVNSVSCGSVGSCSAGGAYTDGSGHVQAYLVSENNGSWGKAKQVPGVAALNQGGFASLDSVSCASAGNCSAGGVYSPNSSGTQVFVADEIGGAWSAAEQISGMAALDQGAPASISSISCASAGNCSVVGTYRDGSGNDQAFVVNQASGTWGTAQEIPGTAALNQGGDATAVWVSCGSAGNCSAVGSYQDSSGDHQVFVVSETNGTWGTAQEVPGTAALDQGGYATISSISCPSAGNCTTGGRYQASDGHVQPFVATQTNGTWDSAQQVPGITTLNQDGIASITALSCASAGNCSAGGSYTDSTDTSQAFVVNQINGIWGAAEEVPGTAALNQGPPVGNASISSISCVSAGNCSAGGAYTDSTGNDQPFVIAETKGTWGTAEEVPGMANLDVAGSASITSVSCVSTSHCGGGGAYTDAAGHRHAYLVRKT
jgi:hypothetical protein